MTGIFDPSTFLNMTMEGANSTKLEPIPDGEYPAVIDSVTPKEWTSRDQTKSGLKLEIPLTIDSPDLREKLGRDKVTVRYDVMLDLTEAGTLDMGKGKNVALGRLREAVGLNTPGAPFSFSMLAGRALKAKVTQRVEGENIYNDVKAVTRLT